MFNLPQVFIDNIENAFREDGKRWLPELPSLIKLAQKMWNLSNITPVYNLSYNFVAFAQQNGKDVVLKMGVPNRELLSEINALQLFNGDGCVRLLASDPKNYMFIMERLSPGEMLVSLPDDEQATHIAAEVMTHLWRSAPEGIPFIRLSEWFGELKNLRPTFGGGTGPFPVRLVEFVEATLPGLFASSDPEVLMHGDFHHFNVLSSERGWLVIDPKGVIGPRGYEAGPLLTNPFDTFFKMPDVRKITERRVSILSERLGLERRLILDWAICHCLLSGWWDLREDFSGTEYSVACGELFLGLRDK